MALSISIRMAMTSWESTRGKNQCERFASAGRRYAGGDEFKGGKAVQEYREIGYNGYQLERGDIVLLHKKHVCLAYDTDGSSVMTMNGNQGNGNCIKLVKRSIDDVVNGRKLYFIHVLV